MKKLMVGVSAALVVGVAMAAEISYWDPDEEVTKSAACGAVTSTTTSLGEGWYVVEGTVGIPGTLTLEGDVNLVLADGAELTVAGGIAGGENNLTVWGQAEQTGKMSVSGTNGVDGVLKVVSVIPPPGSDLLAAFNQFLDGLEKEPGVTLSPAMSRIPTVSNIVYETSAGTDGEAGIVCTTLTINGGTVEASGGNGGNGGDGGDGDDGGDGWGIRKPYGDQGERGDDGGNGGKGGAAVACTTCILSNGTLVAKAGKGGNGGNGGDGGDGGNAMTGPAMSLPSGALSEPTGGYGGNGGNGGDGGAGGRGLVGDLVACGGSFDGTGGTAGYGGTNGVGGAYGLGGWYTAPGVERTGSDGKDGAPGKPGAVGAEGKAFADEPDLRLYVSILTDGVVWDLKTPLVTFNAVEIVGGIAEPGTPGNRWEVGAEDARAITAYILNGELVIEGTGAVRDFKPALDDPAPWTASEVKKITVSPGITKIGRNAFLGIDDKVKVNGYETSFFKMMSGAYGAVDPSEIVGKVGGLKVEAVEVSDGVVHLGVSVSTSGDLTAQTKDWAKANPTKVELSGDKAYLTIPATGDKGFMVLQAEGTATTE